MKTITINGNNFSDLNSFYDEVEKVLILDLTFKMGRNLNAFNDVLRGGFRVVEYEEPYKLIWLNLNKSEKDLGKEMMEILLEIISEHEHIEFTIKE